MGRGVESPPLGYSPSGRGVSSATSGGGMEAPVFSGGRSSGSQHRGGWGRPEFCRPPPSSALDMPSASSYCGLPVGGASGVYSRLVGKPICYRVSPAHSSSLLQDVLRPEGAFRQAPYNRPVSAQQVAQEDPFQNGGPSEGCEVPFPWSLGRQARPQGRVSSLAPGSSSREVLRLCPGEKDFRLPGPSFWPGSSSLALHSSSEAREEGFTSSGYQDHFLFGRFPVAGPIPAGGGRPYQDRRWPPPKTRFPYQLEEIDFDTPEAPRISGGCSGPGGNDLLSSRRQGGESPRPGGVFGKSGVEEVGVGDSGRFLELRGGLCSSGEAVAETRSGLDEFPLVSFGPACSGGDRRGPSGSSSSMGQQVLPGVLGACSTGLSLPSPHDRCLSGGLGRGFASPPSSREVECSSEESVDQLAGVESDSSFSPPFSAPPGGSLCVAEVGQRHCPFMYQEARLLGLPGALVPVQRGPGFSSPVWNSPGPPTPAGGLERLGGQSIKRRSHFDRMVSGRLVLPDPLRLPGHPASGPDGNFGERQALQFCLPVSGRPSLCDGRLLLRLESLGFSISFPSFPDAPGGGALVELLPGGRIRGGAPVALRTVVHPSSRSVSSQTSPPGGPCSVPGNVRWPCRTIGGISIPASRLDLMRASLLADGFSNSAVDIILDCHKQSTCTQYQSTWSKFLDFLDSENVRPDRLRLCHVHNFLAHESEVGNKAYRTIATYKCALALPLKICFDLDLDNVKTQKFMMGAWNRNPPKARPMPSWDLSDLLLFLRSDLFEDLESVSFSLLTQKVLALVLIASGRRISEIANLSRISYVQGSRTYVEWLPGFRAKWSSGFTGFVPQSPSILRMKSSNDRFLRNCPVRALEIYMARRRDVVYSRNDDCLWTLGKAGLASTFRSLVKASRRHWSKSVQIDLFPHQAKRFAVSYCWKYFRDVEEKLPVRTGNSSSKVLKKSYLGPVPDIRLPCVVPLGTIFPIS